MREESYIDDKKSNVSFETNSLNKQKKDKNVIDLGIKKSCSEFTI